MIIIFNYIIFVVRITWLLLLLFFCDDPYAKREKFKNAVAKKTFSANHLHSPASLCVSKLLLPFIASVCTEESDRIIYLGHKTIAR